MHTHTHKAHIKLFRILDNRVQMGSQSEQLENHTARVAPESEVRILSSLSLQRFPGARLTGRPGVPPGLLNASVAHWPVSLHPYLTFTPIELWGQVIGHRKGGHWLTVAGEEFLFHIEGVQALQAHRERI